MVWLASCLEKSVEQRLSYIVPDSPHALRLELAVAIVFAQMLKFFPHPFNPAKNRPISKGSFRFRSDTW